MSRTGRIPKFSVRACVSAAQVPHDFKPGHVDPQAVKIAAGISVDLDGTAASEFRRCMDARRAGPRERQNLIFPETVQQEIGWLQARRGNSIERAHLEGGVGARPFFDTAAEWHMRAKLDPQLVQASHPSGGNLRGRIGVRPWGADYETPGRGSATLQIRPGLAVPTVAQSVHASGDSMPTPHTRLPPLQRDPVGVSKQSQVRSDPFVQRHGPTRGQSLPVLSATGALRQGERAVDAAVERSTRFLHRHGSRRLR